MGRCYAGAVRVGYLGQVGIRVARADVVRFNLDELELDRYVHRAPVISR